MPPPSPPNRYFPLRGRCVPEVSYAFDAITAGHVKIVGYRVPNFHTMRWQAFEVFGQSAGSKGGIAIVVVVYISLEYNEFLSLFSRNWIGRR